MYTAVPSSMPTPVIIAGEVIVGDCETSPPGARNPEPGASTSLARPKSTW